MSSLFLLSTLTSLARPAPLTIATASDLAPAQPDLSSSFQKLTGHSLKFVTGASGILARQVEHGAPFDVFLSANKAYIVDLAAQGHIRPESVQVYAFGRLGVWIPEHRQPTLEDLRQSKRIAIANPRHAPYGSAARQALERSGLWGVLKDRIVMSENVRQALQYGESGNVDAVVTAWSLVSTKGGALVASGLHDPIEQSGGIVATSRQLDAARRFLEFLRGAEGVKILKRHGLEPVRTGRSK